jgi:TBC1 domain family member 13
MNEILATMYYAFYDVNMPQEYFLEYFESDLFFCFNTIVSEIRDSFVRTMDNEMSGINGKVAEFDYIMMKCDPELHSHLANEGLDPQYYSLRWLMLLLAQEFDMNNVIKMWDCVLADHDRFTFVNFICVAMVESKRDYLLKNQFSECLALL